MGASGPEGTVSRDLCAEAGDEILSPSDLPAGCNLGANVASWNPAMDRFLHKTSIAILAISAVSCYNFHHDNTSSGGLSDSLLVPVEK